MRSFWSYWCECMFYCWVAIFMSIGVYAVAAHVVSSEKIDGLSMRAMDIVEFNGHRYVVHHNYWSAAGDSFCHDPDCPCTKKNAVQKILDEVKVK